MDEPIQTVREAVNALARRDNAVAALLGVSAPTLANWIKRGRIPPQQFIAVSEALKARGRTIDPKVFGMRSVKSPL